MGGRRGRRVAAVALVCALLGVAAAPGIGGASAGGLGESTADPSGVADQQTTPANGTVRHEDPRSVDRPGDVAAVRRYLSGRLAGRLGGATASISEGQYEAGRALLGDEYDAQLARYVEVAGGTEDDGAAESFRSAGNRTRDLADSTRSFDETYGAYQEARDSGETARARALGRRLIERSREVSRTEDRLTADLRTIEDATGHGTGEARERIGAVAGSVRERADAVARETFVPTRLSAEAERAEASFVEPTTVRGRLVAENGSGLAGMTVLVGADGEAVAAETNGSGAFVAAYRPVRLAVDADSVPVRYVPADASGYLGARANASVSVTAVTPAVEVSAAPPAAAFGDDVTVSGSVTAGGVGVPGVPVVASVDGVPLGSGVTDGSGGYALSGALPASVPAGGREVAVRVDQTGRAVAGASGAAAIAVEPTATSLSLSGSVESNGTAALSGRLRTDDGRALAGRTVRILVGGRPAGTATTGDSGRFSARVEPGVYGAGPGDSVTAAASFSGDGTSLERSEASATLSVPAADGGGSDTWWLVGLVLVGLLAAGGFAFWRRGAVEGASEGEDPATGSAPGDEPAAGVAPSGDHDGWRERAAGLLDAGETDAAVERAYAVVRARLASELGATGALTHWEFYAAVEGDGLAPGRVEALRSLTEAYERARFAPGAVTAEDADAAVERVDEALPG